MAKLMYENHFILNRKLHKEYFRFCYRKMQKQTQLISGLLAVLSLAISGCLFLGLHFIPGAVIGLVLALYFVFVIFFGNFQNTIKAAKLPCAHSMLLHQK